MVKENIPITLPQKIFIIYNFFKKSQDKKWVDNPFKFYKKINNIEINIAKNISNLNFYQIDFPLDNRINPNYLIKYLKNIDYRNIFSSDIILFKEISKKNDSCWVEEENYNGIKSTYNCLLLPLQLIFYTNYDYFDNNTSQSKYYNAFKIINEPCEKVKTLSQATLEPKILRYETVLNNLDIDQNIDIIIYINMIINILRANYDLLKIKFNFENIHQPTEFDISNNENIDGKTSPKKE
jgi:hypothetical protein